MRIAYGTYIPQLHPSIYMAIGAKLIGDVKLRSIGRGTLIGMGAIFVEQSRDW